MKIACDVQVAQSAVEELRKRGHFVVEAAHGEPDHHVFEEADAAGVELYVSTDNDWRHHARNRGKEFLCVSLVNNGEDCLQTIFRKISEIKNRKRKP